MDTKATKDRICSADIVTLSFSRGPSIAGCAISVWRISTTIAGGSITAWEKLTTGKERRSLVFKEKYSTEKNTQACFQIEYLEFL